MGSAVEGRILWTLRGEWYLNVHTYKYVHTSRRVGCVISTFLPSYCHRVPTESILKLGWGDSGNVMTKTYTGPFTPMTVLAQGGWPDAAKGETRQFFDPRFMMEISPSIVDSLFPWMPNFITRADEVRSV